jgi:branched-chain amino acid transport system ATP-binding protein
VALELARSCRSASLFRAFGALDNVALAVQARSGSSLRFWTPLATGAGSSTGGARRSRRDRPGRTRERAGQPPRARRARALRVGLALANSSAPAARRADGGHGAGGIGAHDPPIDGLKARITVLLIGHDMDAVFRLADRISVLVTAA